MTDTQYRLYFTHREEGWPEYLTWAPPDDPPRQPVKNHVPEPDLLLSEEVLQIVENYYREKGQSVPKDEYEACMEEIRRERQERDNPQQVAFTPQPVAPSRPEYGTPEYWKMVQHCIHGLAQKHFLIVLKHLLKEPVRHLF